MGLKICVSTFVKKKKQAVYVASIIAGNKERNTLVIKIIVINDFQQTILLKKLLKSYLQLIRLKKKKEKTIHSKTLFRICRFKKHLIQLKKSNTNDSNSNK